MIRSMSGPRSSKALPKAKLAPKKRVRVTVWWSAAGLLHTASWIPVKSLHLRSMLSKSMRRTENCNACSWRWSTEGARFFSTTMPDCTSHNQCLKTWTNWAVWFCLILHSHLILSSNISTTLQWKCFHYQQEAENAFREFVESQSTDFYATGINKLISRGPKCVDCNGSYFD